MKLSPIPTAPRLQKTVQTAIHATLETAAPRYPALVSALDATAAPVFAVDVSWVDDAEMQALNRDFRGKNKPTDVLSFPLFETDGEESQFPSFQGEMEEITLGDLVISLETAARQAVEQNHDLECEIAFLAIHGTLHLLGFDHAQDNERRQMFRFQDAIFLETRNKEKETKR